MRDIDDDELIRTDSGIYNIIYTENSTGVGSLDFDDRLQQYENEVDELIRDLDEAEEDLDEDLKKDRDDSDELNDINNQSGYYLTEGDREDIDDLTDKLYDAIQDFNDDTKEYTEDELDMLRNDDLDEGSE
mmetsp:Transcript_22292/g.3701  ORF Transcript_22292/g.3701 Transcript_22292/m.3701 type:complete len:131 (+) Transcript_22292:579-971(+)|eukprot:CAMPEP_0168314130 /NCGR_PEP_ID=MMETSP0210-20121227/6523_1 /TAXON_ID=40633 /ORGANISM="Condylostoma magnum, Strain COL2" /LENGTH=130 /DNA_ID=CAMNT_0008279159 /DNA_START=568 /DNA_END=960 /DNA_ORIENTATION=+